MALLALGRTLLSSVTHYYGCKLDSYCIGSSHIDTVNALLERSITHFKDALAFEPQSDDAWYYKGKANLLRALLLLPRYQSQSSVLQCDIEALLTETEKVNIFS